MCGYCGQEVLTPTLVWLITIIANVHEQSGFSKKTRHKTSGCTESYSHSLETN